MRTIEEVVEELRIAKFDQQDGESVERKNKLLDEILKIHSDEQRRCIGYLHPNGLKSPQFD